MKKSPLTHFDAQGAAHIVDVSAKPTTARTATATATIALSAQTLALVESGSAKKGDVLGIARIAAIMAAKKTAEIIPLCHPLPLSHIAVDFTLHPRVRPRKTPYKHSRNRQNHPPNGGRDGGINRRLNRCPDDLRYVKGGR